MGFHVALPKSYGFQTSNMYSSRATGSPPPPAPPRRPDFPRDASTTHNATHFFHSRCAHDSHTVHCQARCRKRVHPSGEGTLVWTRTQTQTHATRTRTWDTALQYNTWVRGVGACGKSGGAPSSMHFTPHTQATMHKVNGTQPAPSHQHPAAVAPTAAVAPAEAPAPGRQSGLASPGKPNGAVATLGKRGLLTQVLPNVCLV